MPPFTLSTNRLCLVLQTPEEALAWVETLPPGVRAEVSPAWIEGVKATKPGDYWSLGFRVEDATSRETVGGCAFKGPPNPEGMVEIAYGIDPPHQGKGYATEVARALVEFALGSSQVRLVRGHTKPDNAASIRVMEKAGFHHVGEVMDPEDGLVARLEQTRVTS